MNNTVQQKQQQASTTTHLYVIGNSTATLNTCFRKCCNATTSNDIQWHQMSSVNILQFMTERFCFDENCGFMLVYSTNDSADEEAVKQALSTLEFIREQQGFPTRLSIVTVGVSPAATNGFTASFSAHPQFFVTASDDTSRWEQPVRHLIQLIHNEQQQKKKQQKQEQEHPPVQLNNNNKNKLLLPRLTSSIFSEDLSSKNKNSTTDGEINCVSTTTTTTTEQVEKMPQVLGQEQPSATETAVTPRLNETTTTTTVDTSSGCNSKENGSVCENEKSNHHSPPPMMTTCSRMAFDADVPE